MLSSCVLLLTVTGVPILQAQSPELVPQQSSGGMQSASTVVVGASGAWVATLQAGGPVLIYDVESGKISRRIAAGVSGDSIAAHPSKDVLAIAGGGALVFYDVAAGKTLWKSPMPPQCRLFQFTSDGTKLLGACPEESRSIPAPSVRGVIRSWDVATGKELPAVVTPEGFSPVGPFSEGGLWIICARIIDPVPKTGPIAAMRLMHASKEKLVVNTQTGKVIEPITAFAVLALSAKMNSAVVREFSGTLKFINLANDKSGPAFGSISFSGHTSMDGTFFLVPGMSTPAIVNAATGSIIYPPWTAAGFPLSALAPDDDTVALAQFGGVVTLTSISKPEKSRTFGNSVDAEFSQALDHSMSDALAHLAAQGRPTKKAAALSLLGIRQKQAEEMAVARRPGEQDAGAAAKTYIMKFGGPVSFPPVASFLDNGRLLAVLSADLEWDLWDVATGNRLPFRKPVEVSNYPGTLTTLHDLTAGPDLSEIEASFGRSAAATTKTAQDREAPHGLPSGSYSSDGVQYLVPLVPAKKQLDDSDEDHAQPGLRVFDVSTRQPVFDLPDILPDPALPAIAPNGKVLLGADRYMKLGIWDRRTGELLGSLQALQEGEWLVTTPSGLFDGSPRGWSEIGWRDPQGISVASSEVFFNEFYRPGLLADLLDGHAPQPPRTIAQVDRRQPTVTLSSTNAVIAGRTAVLHLTVAEAPASVSQMHGGVRDVRLFRNGSLIKVWHGEAALQAGSAALDATVPLVAGNNHFLAYAFNRDNVKSADAELKVQCVAPQRPGTEYILSIGIDHYANAAFDLSYAQADAEFLGQSLARAQQALGEYEGVVEVNLLNGEATKANILLALSLLSGKGGLLPTGAPAQLATLKPAQPEDTIEVYFAGHGMAWHDRFYLVPHDLGYDGPRSAIRGSLQKVLASSVSDLDLEDAFESIDVARSLLIIDACNSGKALDSEDERRGPMNSKGLAQLAYEKGMYVLTASQAYQAALESSQLGHGYLTYALAVEGLSTPAADTQPMDGKVSVVEWFEFASRRVPQMQSIALNRPSPDGRSVVFDAQERSVGRVSRLQSPRLYYRRDRTGMEMTIVKLK